MIKTSTKVLLIGIYTAALAQAQFQTIQGDGQVYSSSTEAAVRAAGGPFRSLLRELLWPSVADGALREWQLNTVPRRVLTFGTDWARRIVKASLLPGDLIQRWRAIEQFNRADCLIFRYFDGNRRVQIVENGSAVIVVVAPAANEPRQVSVTQAQGLIGTAGSAVLNLPESPDPQFSLQSAQINNGAETLWYGYMNRSPQEDAREWDWWTRITVVTDGATVAFLVPENSPSNGATFGGATSGNGKRFGDRG